MKPGLRDAIYTANLFISPLLIALVAAGAIPEWAIALWAAEVSAAMAIAKKHVDKPNDTTKL